jgi:Xaa-Pro aminopeptidase
MPSPDFHRRRRDAFLDALDGPVVLFAGGFLSRNYPANVFPFRADSSFLYFFPRVEPGAAAFFDPADRKVTLFLPARTAGDALWHGAMPSLDEERQLAAVDACLAVEELESHVERLAAGRRIRSLAVACPKTTARARRLTGEALDFDSADGPGDPAVVDAIFRLRACKEPEEIAEMERTAAVTNEAHVNAMAHTRVGGTEQEIAGIVDGTFFRHGCTPAYLTILSVRGEVLHNHHHDNPLRKGDLLLLDAGAEAASGYCSDVTRTWPVDGRFTPEQAEVYDIVLHAELAAIRAVKAGVRYGDVHRTSARVIADGLVQMGLMRGDPDQLVEAGAHAVFFPHGVGHLIGIDVHDMEGFGDRVHYPGGRKRSDQFGTCFLRMDRDLETGHVFTIEPGIYFVPAILHETELRAKFGSMIDYDAAERFLALNEGRGFGGIRIEDDVLCTGDGARVLTEAVPKTREAVEAVVGTA